MALLIWSSRIPLFLVRIARVEQTYIAREHQLFGKKYRGTPNKYSCKNISDMKYMHYYL